jgi:hypothetical protein
LRTRRERVERRKGALIDVEAVFGHAAGVGEDLVDRPTSGLATTFAVASVCA